MAHRSYDICVLGAYGSYGSMCCELLTRLEWSSRPLRVALVGRDIAKLRALQQTLTEAAEHSSPSCVDLLVYPEPVDANSYDGVLHVVQQARVLISFIRTSSADTVGTLVSACIAAQCHYVDICALPSVLKTVAQRYHAAAAAAGCFIFPGAGFDYAITDVAAQRALHLYRALHAEAPASLEKVLCITPGPAGIVIKQHIIADALQGVPAAAPTPAAAGGQGCRTPMHSSNHDDAAAAADTAPECIPPDDSGDAPWAAAAAGGKEQEVLLSMRANKCAPSLSAISTCASSSWRSLASLTAAAEAADEDADGNELPQGAKAASVAVEPEYRAALAPLVTQGAINLKGAASTAGTAATAAASWLAPAWVKPGQLLGHLVRYSPVLKRYSIPFPLGGEAERFLLQRYTELMSPQLAAAAGGPVRCGSVDGLLGAEGLTSSGQVMGAASSAAPDLDTRLALPGLKLAAWSAGKLLWALYYLTLVVWAVVGFLLARVVPPLRPLYLRLLTTAANGHVTADVAAADKAMSDFTFQLLLVMGGCKVRPATLEHCASGIMVDDNNGAWQAASQQDSSSSSDGSRSGREPAGEEAAGGSHMSDSSKDIASSRRPDQHQQVAALHYPAAKAAGAHEEGHGLLHSSSRTATAAAATGAVEGRQDDSEALPVLKVVCSGPASGKWSQLTSLCAALAAQRLLLLSQQQRLEELQMAGEGGAEKDVGAGSFSSSTAGAALDVAGRRDQAAWEDAISVPAPDAAAVVTTSTLTGTTSSGSRGHSSTSLAGTKAPAADNTGGGGSSESALDRQLAEKPWIHPTEGIKQSRGQLALLPPFVDFSVMSMGSQEHQLLSAEYTEELGGKGGTPGGCRVPHGVVTPAVVLAGDPWFMCELHRLADVQLCVRL